MLDNPLKFNGYIAISPYFSEGMVDSIYKFGTNIDVPVFYYLSYSEKDLTGHIESVSNAIKKMKTISNSNFEFKFEKILNQTHVSQVPTAIESGLQLCNKYACFNKQTFTKKDFKNQHVLNMLISFYEKGLKIYKYPFKATIQDLEYCSFLISKYGKIEEYLEFGNYCISIEPDLCTGYYSLGYYYEIQNQYEKALINYQKGYQKLGADIINKADFKEPIIRLENKTHQKIKK
jgi:tetratricopeptide (TPR) repeat protein